MSPFVKAMIFTAVPIVALSAISMVGVAANQHSGATIGWALLWFLPAIIAFVVLMGSIVHFVQGERQIAAGMLAGFGIGVVALGGSCFAIVSSGFY